MASSITIVKASKDKNLKERTEALMKLNQREEFENQNVTNTVEDIMLSLVGQSLDDSGQTIADVYASKEESVAQVILEPGADPAAVTDEFILTALRGLGYVD